MVGRVHDRMPVILEERTVDEWSFSAKDDRERLQSLLVPAAEDVLNYTPVSSRANSVKNDDPSILDEVEYQVA